MQHKILCRQPFAGAALALLLQVQHKITHKGAAQAHPGEAQHLTEAIILQGGQDGG
jgi:hypothetical protein